MRQGDLNIQIEAIITNCVEEIQKRVIEGVKARNPKEMMETELAIHDVCKKLAGEFTGLVLNEILQDEAFQESATKLFKSGKKRLRDGGYHTVKVQTLAGNTVEVIAKYLAPKIFKHPSRKRRLRQKRGSNGKGVYPVLASLGIAYRCTPALLSEVARQTVGSSSDQEARANLARLGVELDIKTVWRITNALGADCMETRNKRLEEAEFVLEDNWSGLRVAACVDGGRVCVRQPHRKGPIPKGKKRRGFKADWKEPKLLIVYVLDAEGKRDPRFPPIIDGTLEDCDGVIALLIGYLRMLGVKNASELIILGDGARWIWNRVQTIIDGVGIDPKKVTAIVDYYHAVEHLQKVADLKAGWSDTRRKRWVNKYKALLKNGKVKTVIAAIASLCRGRNKKKIVTEMNFFKKNQGHMKYAWYKRRRIPIGSGAVESCIRRVVNLRMKGSGIFWLQENAEAFLHLRCQYKAGRWDETILNMLENQDVRLAA